jgi:hypothetical protein
MQVATDFLKIFILRVRKRDYYYFSSVVLLLRYSQVEAPRANYPLPMLELLPVVRHFLQQKKIIVIYNILYKL